MRLIAWRRLRHRYDGQSRKGRRHAEHLRISTQRPARLDEQEPHRRQEKRGISRQECVWQDIRKVRHGENFDRSARSAEVSL